MTQEYRAPDNRRHYNEGRGEGMWMGVQIGFVIGLAVSLVVLISRGGC